MVSGVLPVDEFDASCRAHDAAYATPGTNLSTADLRFAAENLIPWNPKRLAAGVAVGAQGILRGVGILGRDSASNQVALSTNRKISKQGHKSLLPWEAYAQSSQGQQQSTSGMARKNRVAAGISRAGQLGELLLQKAVTGKRAKQSAVRRNKILAGEAVERMQAVQTKVAPAAYGNVVSSAKSTVRTTKRGIVVSGKDVVATVNQTPSTAWQLGALLPVHPAYYNGTSLSNHCRAYTKYAWRGVRYSFITKQPTSVTGQVILSHRPNALEPAEDGASGAFISRVMSRERAAMGPIWSNLSCEIVTRYKEANVDCFISDWADNVCGDMEVYVQSNSTDDAGYIMMEYEIEFFDTIVQPHLSQIPVATDGVGTSTMTIAALGAGAVPGWGLSITATAIANSAVTGNGNGRVFKVVFDKDLSTIGAGATWAITNPRITPGALTVDYASGVTVGLRDGYTAYAVTRGGNLVTLYSTYDHALAGALGGMWVNDTTGASSASTLSYRYYLVRFGEDEVTDSS